MKVQNLISKGTTHRAPMGKYLIELKLSQKYLYTCTSCEEWMLPGIKFSLCEKGKMLLE